MSSTGEVTDNTALDDQVKELQEQNAEMQGQIDTKQQIYELKRDYLLSKADEGWDLIISMFILIKDFIILIVYLFEMRLMLFIFVELIPTLFVKLRDALTNFYIDKKSKGERDTA